MGLAILLMVIWRWVVFVKVCFLLFLCVGLYRTVSEGI